MPMLIVPVLIVPVLIVPILMMPVSMMPLSKMPLSKMPLSKMPVSRSAGVVSRKPGAAPRWCGRFAATLVQGLMLLALAATARGADTNSVTLQPYWVVGSFTAQTDAVAEAHRLAARVGVTPAYRHFQAVDGIGRYRLLVALPPTTAAQSALRSQLATAGVTNPWQVQLQPTMNRALASAPDMLPAAPRSADAAGAQLPAGESANWQGLYYLVVASTVDVNRSVQVELALNKLFARVTSMTVLVGNKVQHRVMVGPAHLAALDGVQARLQQEGFNQAWLLPASAGDDAIQYNAIQNNASQENLVLDAMERQAAPGVQLPQPIAAKMPTKETSPAPAAISERCGRAFNLARLNRDCKP